MRTEIEHTTMRHVTGKTEIWYDPDPLNTVISEDEDFTRVFYETEEDINVARLSPWVLRIVLNRDAMVAKGLHMADIGDKINLEFPGDVQVIYTDDSADTLVVRMRIIMDDEYKRHEEEGQADDDNFLRAIESNMLTQMSLKGVEEISKVFLREDKRSFKEVRFFFWVVVVVVGVWLASSASLD